jgi:hypothetical protein
VLIAQTGLVNERLRVREIDDDEGRRLVRIVRRGSGSVVTWRRAQMVRLGGFAHGEATGPPGLRHGAATRRSARRTNWQPVTAVTMMAGMLTEQLAANRGQLELLERARRELWLLDDATVDRVN